MNTPTTDPTDTPASLFLDGFAAGAELSRQSAFAAWMRWSWFHWSSGSAEYLRQHRDREEQQGFDRGVELGRLYAGKPAASQTMSATQHNRHPGGRWA